MTKLNANPAGGEGATRRVAIYRRVSTDRQADEGTSLAEQERACRELAEREGYEVVAIFSDVLSGADPDRPDYNRMLDAAIAGEFEAIAIYAIDRFGRDVIQVTTSLRTLDEVGVKVLSTRGAIDRETPEGQLMTTIEAAFAEFERAKIKMRARSGLAARARQGIPHGSSAPFGYRKGDDGHWLIEPAEAETGRRMARLRVDDGLSYHAIAARLNKAGLPTRKGGAWSATIVRKFLESRHTRGFYWHKGEWRQGRHEPIFDDATFAVLQALIGRDRRFAPSRSGRRPGRHLFTGGTLACGACGESMWARSGPTPADDFYACKTNLINGAGSCPMPWHKRAEVDSRFLAIFEREFLDLDATRERVAAELDGDLRDAEAQAASAEGQLARLERQRQRVEADYLAEELGAAAYDRLSARLAREHQAARAERDRIAEHAEALRSARASIDAESETLRRLAEIRNTVAAHARDALAQQDLEALRGIIATAFGSVTLTQNGLIGGLEPGAAGFLSTMGQRDSEGAPRYAIPLRAGGRIGSASLLAL
jgi:DNA invertase Pin-like site-specific DNA recombinase